MNGATFDRTETRHSRWRDLPEQLDALWDACLQEQRGSDVARALTRFAATHFCVFWFRLTVYPYSLHKDLIDRSID